MAGQTLLFSNDDIHVLIKNDASVAYNELYILGTNSWYINEQPVEAQNTVNIIEWMEQWELSVATISSAEETGSFSIMDKEGNPIKDGYTGTLEVRLYDESAGYDGGVVLINILSMEDYVRFVLPSEMPSYFSYEALKAQAVCARTLAVRQRVNTMYEKWNADLDDSTDYQVFHAGGTNALTDMAVRETEGEVITYEGEPIDCYYYSTSAGNSNDLSVWLSEELPYIRQKNFTQLRDIDFSDEESLTEFLNEAPLSYDSDSPFYRWTAELDFSYVTDEQYGQVKGFSVSKRAANSGYITEIQIHYESGSCLLGNEYDIRKFLGQALKTLTLADGSIRDNFTVLPSSCFVTVSKNGRSYVLQGGGFGHGIGMSQYGASKMAEDGLDYKAILSFYYEGVTIQRLDEIR
jgi:stage II sporulation protein D